MDSSALILKEWVPIIDFEVRRCGAIEGHDREDLKQEMLVVASRCLPRLDGTNTGRTYVRTSIRNALQNLKRAATTAGRLPQDARGRGLPFWYLDDPLPDGGTHGDRLAFPSASPEAQAIAREQLSILDEHLNDQERGLLTLFMQDAIENRDDKKQVEMLLQRSAKILHRVASTNTTRGPETMTTIPQTPADELPSCHVDGGEPIGYETNIDDAVDCQDCPDKFTCLPKGIATGLIPATLDIDPEVAAVLRDEMTYDIAIDRVTKRQDIRENNGTVPDALKFNAQVKEEEKTMTTKSKKKPAAKKPKTSKAPAKVEDDSTPKVEKPAKKKPAAKKPSAKKPAAKKPSAKKKPAAKKPAAKKPKVPKEKAAKKPKVPKEKAARGPKGQVRLLEDGRLEKWDGRFLPAPKEITKEKVEEHLANKIKLGLPFDLTIGMKLTLTRRDGSKVVIAITSKGYTVEQGMASAGELHPDGTTFSSLSAACMWSSPTFRTVSCNDVFNFEKHNNIEISGKGVPGKKFSKGSAA